MKPAALLILALALSTLSAKVTYQQALKIPTVIEFTEQTGFDTDKYLKKAIKNKHWQSANKHFYNREVVGVIGKRKYKTIPYDKVIKELKSASEQGIILAMFQGYRVSSIVSRKEGKYAKRDTAYFAKQLMERGSCLGYVETAYGYVNNWYRTGNDWKSADQIMKAAKHECENDKLADWLKKLYRKNSAQYKAVNKRLNQ